MGQVSGGRFGINGIKAAGLGSMGSKQQVWDQWDQSSRFGINGIKVAGFGCQEG
jgi:hypothetical protein